MSEKKRKPQVIHVDRVIIKANEVIIQEERDEKEDRRENRRDPWGFFGSTDAADEERERDGREDEDDKKERYWF